MSVIYEGPAVTSFQYNANLYQNSVACSHFISGMDLARAVDSTYELRDKYPDWWQNEVHEQAPFEKIGANKLAHTARNYRRVAQFCGDIGCVLLPDGHDAPFFDVDRYRVLPRSGQAPLITVDFDAGRSPAPEMQRAMGLAFADEARTSSLIVLHKGQCLYEHYSPGVSEETKLASWSMGKSVVSVLIGTLCAADKIDLARDELFECWRMDPDDPRRLIRLQDLLRMSSGLRFSGYEDPAYTWGRGISDHLLPYAEAIDFYTLSTSAAAEHPPATVGRYRNCDIASAAALAKAIVEADGGDFVRWIYETLNPILGDEQFCFCPDAYGNPIFTGLTYVTARGWARFAQLMLDNGRAGSRKILSSEYVQFAQTVPEAWLNTAADWHRAQYAGGFWVNRHDDGGPSEFELPSDAYFAAGGGCNYAIIVPSLDLVVVRQGDLRGKGGKVHLNAALRELRHLL